LKKIYYILISILLFGALQISASPNNEEMEAKTKSEKYIRYVYDKLAFKKMQKLSFEAFSKGYYGYLNLKEAGKINNSSLLTICDFSLSSNLKRLWIIDVNKKKVLLNTLVSHGMGTGEEYATKFSNVHESHQSSLGFYTTGETYLGDNGYSLKLHGEDGAFNNNAFDRAIVMHGADYVSSVFSSSNNRIGRSHGCPALPRELTEIVIDKIKNGQVLFIYHPTKSYIKASYWLNNRISHLPPEADYLDILQPRNTNPRWIDLANAKDSIGSGNRTITLNNNAVVSDSIKNRTIANAKPTATLINSKNISTSKATEVTPTIRDKDFLYIK
jgi:hypothetical protein